MSQFVSLQECLPVDGYAGTLLGRVWDPSVNGPSPVVLREGVAYDLSSVAPTISELLNREDAVSALRSATSLPAVGTVEDLLHNTVPENRDTARPWLLAPCDLQVIKAGGVTFIASLLERVIEERALGDVARAEELRAGITDALGADLAEIVPGSEEAARLKALLIERGIWSQYLEVAIGPDSEVFTKSACLSAVGVASEVGIYSKSTWNNPEPEMVLFVNAAGTIVGAALGNDVNLRDFEGRSALLLSKAKDNNASCAIGPFVRLFDETFTMEDVRKTEIRMRVEGADGFAMEAVSAMSKISRDPAIIVQQTIGKHHQYPDGFVLFLGTMFAPVIDRDEAGKGFTHKVGDVVRIQAPKLGGLVNRVNHSEAIAPWTFGLAAFMHNLAKRGLLGKG